MLKRHDLSYRKRHDMSHLMNLRKEIKKQISTLSGELEDVINAIEELKDTQIDDRSGIPIHERWHTRNMAVMDSRKKAARKTRSKLRSYKGQPTPSPSRQSYR